MYAIELSSLGTELSLSAALSTCVAMAVAWQRNRRTAVPAFAMSKGAHAQKPRVDVNPGRRTWRHKV